MICLGLGAVTEVIDAIDAAVRETNQDYERELDRRRGASERLKTGEAERARYLSDVRHAIDERYPSQTPASGEAHSNGNGRSSTTPAAARIKDNLEVLEDRSG